MNDVLRQAFPLDDNEDETQYDVTKPPTSAQEYLKRVRLEADQSPDVVVANINREVFKNKQTITVSDSTGFLPSPAEYEPTIKWERDQVASFSDLRQMLGCHKNKIIKQDNPNRPTMPEDTEQDQWCRFCFGDVFLTRLKQRRGDPMITPSSDGEQTTTEPHKNGLPPLLSIISFVSQATLHQVLAFHLRWFHLLGFSISQGCWFYALLACIEKPLLPDGASMIRELARLCAAQRAALESANDERLPGLNLLIAIVTRYFDQMDLCTKR